jgi:ketosteroid isomerase-like protein
MWASQAFLRAVPRGPLQIRKISFRSCSLLNGEKQSYDFPVGVGHSGRRACKEQWYDIVPDRSHAAILRNPKDIANVTSLCACDVCYVSLNDDNPDLKRVMPWCGTSRGPAAIVPTFVDFGRYWEIDAFEIEALFGAPDRRVRRVGRRRQCKSAPAGEPEAKLK